MKQESSPTRPIQVFKSGKRQRDSLGEGPSSKLIVIYGAHLGKEYHLGRKRVLIGRMDRSDIIIDDSSVSREHASIERKDRAPMEPLSTANSLMCGS
jgi:hypothetical protein